MENHKKIVGITVCIAVSVAIFLAVLIVRTEASFVRVAFLDVGQGDAILISRGSEQVLIDTGNNSRALLSELGAFLSPWDRTIEAVLLTHPDQDHVGALPELLAKYDVRLLLSADMPETTEIGRTIRRNIEDRHIRVIHPSAGLSVAFSPETRMETLFPDASFVPDPKNTNASSVVERLRAGTDSFLFTGDLPKEETVLPAEDIRVLKVAHHGSKYSTSDAFLDRMTPEEAVISVGKNSYGHPAEEVLKRLEAHGIKVFRTDTSGAIVYECPIARESSCALVRPKL